MTTEKNSVLKKFVPVAMSIAPIALGAVLALTLGFVSPTAVNADGSDYNYTYDFAPYEGGSDGGGKDYNYTYDFAPYEGSYDDCSYYGDCGGGSYDKGYDDCAYYGDCGGGSYSNDYDDCSYYGDCGGGSYYVPSYNYSYQPYSYDYDYDYDYNYESYEYSYDYYEYDYDYCSNIPGIQGSNYDCNPPHDECSNLPGNQPDGYDCHRDRDDDEDISCDLTVDDRTVEEGDEVTLEWDIDGDANYASINQGVGRVDEDGGEEDVEVDEDTTFKLTVRNDDGDEDTCSVTVRVDEEDNTFSSIDFEGEPTNNPPQVVYLSSIPYTGLEDIDPTLLSYWLMLIAGAGIAAWYMFRNGLLPSFAFASSEPTVGEETAEEAPVGDVPTATENSFVTALTHDDVEGAVDQIRTAAAHGTSVEDFLEEAATAAQGTALESRINAALEASRQNGIRGAKAALAA